MSFIKKEQVKRIRWAGMKLPMEVVVSSDPVHRAVWPSLATGQIKSACPARVVRYCQGAFPDATPSRLKRRYVQPAPSAKSLREGLIYRAETSTQSSGQTPRHNRRRTKSHQSLRLTGSVLLEPHLGGRIKQVDLI